MNWLRELQSIEWVFIFLFAGLYLAYIFNFFFRTRGLGGSVLSLMPKLIIRSAAFALVIGALLGPSFGESKQEIKSVGKDIMIAVDLSSSMNARDIQPSRLEKIKFELKNLVDAFNSDRIGILIFSNEAFVQCPLTYDQSALNLFIETLNTGLVPSAGTDFGPALSMAKEKLLDAESQSPNPSAKIIILISDGEDFGDQTLPEADDIEEENITLFTLGVGTAGGAKIPTGRGGFKTDRSGVEVVTKLDASTLKKVARETGGKYFEINEQVNDVERLINTIRQIEGEVRDSRLVNVSDNKYLYFLAGAVFLFLIDIIGPIKTIRI